MKLTLQQANRPHYIYAMITEHGAKEVQRTCFLIAEKLDGMGEAIIAKRIRQNFWEGKQKYDAIIKGGNYDPALPPPLPHHLMGFDKEHKPTQLTLPERIEKMKELPPEPKPKRKPRRTQEQLELTPFGEWLETYQTVSVHRMAKEFKFAAGNVSLLRYKGSRDTMLRPVTLEKIVKAVCHYSQSSKKTIVMDLSQISSKWEALCREAFPEVFVLETIKVYKGGEVIDTIELPMDVYDLTTKLLTIYTEHGNGVTVGD